MAYTPPEGNLVPLAFTGGAYTPPFGGEVALAFGPPATAGNLYPAGWTSSAYGTALVYKLSQIVTPGGIAPPPQTGTNEYRQTPDPTIAWKQQFARPTGIAPPAWTNTHYIAWEIQYIDQAGRGSNTMVLGTPMVAFALRTVYPNFISSMVFGTATVAPNQFITATGIGSTNAFGTAQLDINLQRLYPTGVIPANDYGEPVLRNEWEYLRPVGLPSTSPGFPIVENFKRYLDVGMYRDNGNPEQWPPYSPFVENKIRYVGPSGWKSSRFSVIGNLIENKARAITPAGWESFVWSPGNFIGHYTRYIEPASLDSFVSERYHAVYNDAAVLQPSGWKSSRFGTPSDVRNLNRTVIHHSGPSDGFYGTPFVADAIRTVRPGLFYDTYLPMPEVRLNPHPLKPVGIPTPSPTAPVVYEHFNILGPPSVNVHSVPWVGEPFVQNRNKTLFVGPTDQALYGTARVFNYNTYISIGAGDISLYGYPLIQYRNRTVVANTISVPTFSVAHQVRNDLPDPPSQQLLIVPTLGALSTFAKPLITLRGIFPTSLSDWGFGGVTVRGNGVFPTSVVDEDLMGSPLVGGTQYAYPPSVPRSVPLVPGEPEPAAYGDSDDHWTKNLDLGYEWPRLSPHTVYAPIGDGATGQAVRNNPPAPEPVYHAVDGLMAPGYAESRYPCFGDTWISLKHRVIGPVPLHGGQADRLDPSSVVGDGAVVDLRIRYVHPDGIRSQRFGRAVFLDVPQYVYLMDDEGGVVPGDWYDLDPPGSDPPVPPSIHIVAYAPLFDRPVYPTGFAGAVGEHSIELFNREVSPQGIPHRGNPQLGDTSPWGVPLVGYPREYSWGGYDMTLWGTAWFSHYTRDVAPEGFNSDSLESNDIVNFNDRMRVRLFNHARTVVAGNIAAPALPSPSIIFFDRAIIGRGWRDGAISAPAFAMIILPDGWDSSEYGNIDEWEAGKVKAHGDDMSYVSIPKLLHPLAPAGIDDSTCGVPSFVRALYPIGIPTLGFAGPSLTDIYGCSVRIVAPLSTLSSNVLPTPQVAHV